MLVKPNLDQLLPRTENRYTLAILVAKRARQLINGGLPMHESETPNKVTLSCEEVAAGEVLPVEGIHRVEVPLRPDVIEARRKTEAMNEENQRLEIIRDGQVLELNPEREASPEIDMDRFTEAFDQASADLERSAEDPAAEAMAAVDRAVMGNDRGAGGSPAEDAAADSEAE